MRTTHKSTQHILHVVYDRQMAVSSGVLLLTFAIAQAAAKMLLLRPFLVGSNSIVTTEDC